MDNVVCVVLIRSRTFVGGHVLRFVGKPASIATVALSDGEVVARLTNRSFVCWEIQWREFIVQRFLLHYFLPRLIVAKLA